MNLYKQTAELTPVAGQTIGRYRLQEKLGVGGMAVVHRAELLGQEGFSKIVALKLVHSHLALQPHFTQSFISEARLGGYLSHPNIVETLDFGETDQQLFLAMEYIHGMTLGQILAWHRKNRVAMPLDVVLQIMICVCHALDYAHEATDRAGQPLHMVHRDVKPSNILMGSHGQVKLADFGVARAESNLNRTLHSGMIKGTVRYMSPEQAWGERALDSRSDLFAVGLILYELMTLIPIYQGKSPEALLRRAQDAEVTERLSQLPESPIRESLLEFLTRALIREPEGRFQKAEEMAVRLEHLLLELSRRSSLKSWFSSVLAASLPPPVVPVPPPARDVSLSLHTQEEARAAQPEVSEESVGSAPTRSDSFSLPGKAVVPPSSAASAPSNEVPVIAGETFVGGTKAREVPVSPPSALWSAPLKSAPVQMPSSSVHSSSASAPQVAPQADPQAVPHPAWESAPERSPGVPVTMEPRPSRQASWSPNRPTTHMSREALAELMGRSARSATPSGESDGPPFQQAQSFPPLASSPGEWMSAPSLPIPPPYPSSSTVVPAFQLETSKAPPMLAQASQDSGYPSAAKASNPWQWAGALGVFLAVVGITLVLSSQIGGLQKREQASGLDVGLQSGVPTLQNDINPAQLKNSYPSEVVSPVNSEIEASAATPDSASGAAAPPIPSAGKSGKDQSSSKPSESPIARRVVAAPSEPAPAQQGTLFMSSRPQASLFLNGKALTSFPAMDVSIEPGTHALIFEVRPGQRLEHTLVVEAGDVWRCTAFFLDAVVRCRKD